MVDIFKCLIQKIILDQKFEKYKGRKQNKTKSNQKVQSKVLSTIVYLVYLNTFW